MINLRPRARHQKAFLAEPNHVCLVGEHHGKEEKGRQQRHQLYWVDGIQLCCWSGHSFLIRRPAGVLFLVADLLPQSNRSRRKSSASCASFFAALNFYHPRFTPSLSVLMPVRFSMHTYRTYSPHRVDFPKISGNKPLKVATLKRTLKFFARACVYEILVHSTNASCHAYGIVKPS